MKLEIIRAHDDGIETIGNLFLQDDNGATIYKCVTLELPYKDNQHQISCIPCGSYTCKKVGVSHIPYPHISITNVPNGDGICIHKGNFKSDILGCVILGCGFADINKDGEPDLLNSGTTFDKFMECVPDEFQLIISEK